MSLNSVVNNLVRAAAGIPQDITDSDLDAHVAQLLAEEAKSKEKNWSELGLSGLLREGRDSPDPNAPKPNKRFLASVIRTVDGHNSALLRAQAAAARDVRVSRGESSRSGGASRLFGGAMKGVERERPMERRRDRDRETDERVYREREERERESRRRYDTRDHLERGHRSSRQELDEEEYVNRQSGRKEEEREDSRSRRRRQREEDDEEAYFNDSEKRSRREEDERYRRIRREQEQKEDHWTERLERDKERERKIRREEDEDEGRIRRESPGRSERDVSRVVEEESELNGQKERRRKERSESEVGSKRTARKMAKSPINDASSDPDSPRPSGSRRPAVDPALPPTQLSKMDKYFNTSYDPRLDLGEVPKEGFVAEVGWDNMLAILKERGQKRRHQSPTLSDDGYSIPKNISLRKTSPEVDVKKLEKAEKRKKKDELENAEKRKKKDERKKKRGDSEESDGERAKRKATTTTTSDGQGLFDIPYVKKGAVREWDVGK